MGSCPGWIELDNNPNMFMIAAGGGALYEMHGDGSIWWYVGPACSPVPLIVMVVRVELAAALNMSVCA
jgi:hypothetical protein